VAGLASFLGWLTFRTYWLPDQVTPETMATRLSPRR
jgi:hypothetical protein